MADNSHTRNHQFYENFPTEWHVVAKIVSNPSPLVFDVGAHRGESIEAVLNLFPDSKIIAFEANPTLAHDLVQKYINLPQVIINNFAVSSTAGAADFYINEITHSSSLFKINHKSKDSIAINSGKIESLGEINQKISIKAVTIDEIVQSEDIQHIDVLKIDAQGAEIDVLEGARNSLQHTSVVKVEVSLFDFYSQQSSLHKVETLMRDAGLTLYSIPFVSQNPMNGRTDWVEAIYWRKP